MMSLILAALLPLAIYFLYRPIVKLLTPQGVPGVPAFPNPKVLLGDMGVLAEVAKIEKGFGPVMDKVSRELGPIGQIRISFLAT
jgi:hypothetical protein